MGTFPFKIHGLLVEVECAVLLRHTIGLAKQLTNLNFILVASVYIQVCTKVVFVCWCLIKFILTVVFDFAFRQNRLFAISHFIIRVAELEFVRAGIYHS